MGLDCDIHRPFNPISLRSIAAYHVPCLCLVSVFGFVVMLTGGCDAGCDVLYFQQTLLRLCRDKGVFENTPCDSSVVLKLIQECNTAMLSTKCVDTRVELALLDMIEVLLGCTLYKKPAVPETQLIQSRHITSLEEDVADADSSPENENGGYDENEAPKIDLQPVAIIAVTVAEHEETQCNTSTFGATELHNRLEELFQRILE